ncbi:MAG TPA: hypothetical protein VM492_10890 [Sumerlaeia bacterium]|nr:hypothetical protein [Sumerlaeia bacterium]
MGASTSRINGGPDRHFAYGQKRLSLYAARSSALTVILLLLSGVIGRSAVSAPGGNPEQAPQGNAQFQVPDRAEPRDLTRVAASDDESRRRVFTWIDSNTPYYGTYERSRPGSPGSRDAFYSGREFAPWFQAFRRVFDANCGACHRPIGQATRDLTDSTWINLTHPEWSRVLTAPLAKAAGGRERCKEKNGKQPARFQDRSNPVYQGMLAALREGKRSLEANPRADMPGFKPKPRARDFGRLFTGFAGP